MQRRVIGVVCRRPLAAAGLIALLSHGRDVVRARAVAWPEAGLCDLVVYDLRDLDAHPDDAEQLSSLTATTPVLGVAEPLLPDLVTRARHLGVVDVLVHDVDAPTLLDAVLRLAPRSTTRNSHEDDDQLLEGRRDLLRERYGLSRQELKVLQLIATGISNRAIADLMFVSPNTVKTYVRTAYRKIGAQTRSQALLWAAEHGLARNTPPPEQAASGPRSHEDADASG